MAMDRKICEHMSGLLSDHKTIALFMPLKEEVNVLPLFDAYRLEHRFVFPKVLSESDMAFYHVSTYDDFEEGSFNLMEPKSHCERLDPSEIDLFFIPLLVYNDKRHRIGYGKGYYDRYMASLSAYKYGVAYSFQKVSKSFENSHDIACDFVITERGFE